MKSSLAIGLLVPLLAAAASAAGYRNDGKTLQADFEINKEVIVNYTPGACEASLDLEYYQNGNLVHVASSLENTHCNTSAGGYSVRIRYRDREGGLEIKEIAEDWQLDGASATSSRKNYQIPDDVEVVRVSPGKLTCTCQLQPSEESGAGQPTTPQPGN